MNGNMQSASGSIDADVLDKNVAIMLDNLDQF